MVHLRAPAVEHAEKYVQYCTTIQNEDELSLANNLRLTAMVERRRMSDEAREVLLQEVRDEGEQGIAEDRKAIRNLALAEKSVLLAEVMEELGRLQGEDPEDVWPAIAEVLTHADTACCSIRSASDGLMLSMQVSYLKGCFQRMP